MNDEKKILLDKVEKSRDNYINIIEMNPDAVIVIDQELTIAYANRVASELFGKTRDELVGIPFGFPVGEDLPVEIELFSSDLRPRYGEMRVVDTEWDGKSASLVMIRDVTKRKEDEWINRQAQRVESIGRLAGGVAHDLNNLLSPILGYSEMLKDDVSIEKRPREMINEIHKAGIKSKELVHRLLAFGRKQPLKYQPVDMNEVITGFEKLLRRTIREDIEIKIVSIPGLPEVLADSGQLEQVIMNLSVNAQDAMPKGGTLTIKTELAVVDEEFVSNHRGAKAGNYVLTSFIDTGCGMDKEILEHLFEPFFSTKGDLGTGLGLATVYGIVKQHGGNIWVSSQKEEGSTFHVYLPVSETTPAKKTPSNGSEKQKVESCSPGRDTVLLVEDDEQVRRLARIILSSQGYTLLEAENGREALARMEEHQGSIGLLLTDVIMPKMNGKELYSKALELNPTLKVIFMSGYIDDVLGDNGIIKTEISFIQKPFSLKSLVAKVTEVLDQ